MAAPGDDWPCFRHDAQNTACSRGAGRMVSAPTVLGRYRLGGAPSGQHLLADLDGDGLDEIITNAGGPVAAYRATGEMLWRNLLPCGQPFLLGCADLDGDGAPEIVASSGPPASIYVLSGRDGSLRWQQGFAEQVYFANGTRLADLDGDGKADLFLMGNAPAENSWKVGWAYTFEPGRAAPQLLWGPLPLRFNPHYRPQTIVADLDGDGRPKVVVASAGHSDGRHLCVSVYNAATGALEHEATFPNGDRNYGHLQAIRSGGQPRLDLLVVGMLGRPHITFLTHDAQGLREAWHLNETVQIPFNPVADVDGDGALELVYTRINDTGEQPTPGNTALVVRELLTGSLKQELPGLRLQGVVDLDGDGGADLVATTVPGNEVVLDAGTPRQRPLAVPGATLCLVAPRPPLPMMNEVLPNRSGYDVVARDLDGDGQVELLVSTPQGLAGVSPRDGTVRFQSSGGGLDAPRVVGWGRLLPDAPEALLATAPSGLLVIGGDGRRAGRVRLHSCVPRPVVAGRLRPDGDPVVLATRPNGTVVALDGPTLARGRVRRLWSHAGLGAFDAPTIADLDGDGDREIMLCDRATAEPVVVNADGSIRRRLPPLPTDGTPLATGTCAVGRFGAGGKIMVGALSNVGPNDGIAKWTMYDPETGRLIWQREGGPHERGSTCVWDVDADGCDDLVHSHYFDLIALNGRTGDTMWFNGGSVPGYHLVSVADLDGSGQSSLLLSGGYMALYRFDPRGKEIWRTPPLNYDAGSAAALGDVDGDGRMEFATAFSDRLTCYAAATGKVRWNLPLPGAGSAVAAGDINGDGRVEFLWGCTDGNLYAAGCAGPGQPGEVLWQVSLGAPVGPPVLADVDGDGLLEILVETADGWLHVLAAER